MQKFTFSAVLSNYNHARFLPAALGDVLAQTRPFDEILIIDDASSDNSIEVIEGLIRNVPQARLVKNQQNRGVVTNTNDALHEIKGDFVFFVSSDDRYRPCIVEQGEALLARYPDLGMISGNARTWREDTGEERVFTLPFPQTPAALTQKDISAVARRRSFTFHGGANLIRREALLGLGSQWPELKWNADWLMYLLLAIRHPFGVVPEEFVRIRLAPDQYSHASQTWSRQKPVTAEILRLTRERCPEEYAFLRAHALLPNYDPRTLALLLTEPDLRDYLTPRLAWRLLTYNALRGVGARLPIHWKHRLRRLAGV